MGTITIIRKRPGEAAKLVEVEHTLEEIQEEVGGYIQALPLFEDVVMLCYEDAKLMGQPFNFAIPWGDFVAGSVAFVKDDGSSEWASMERHDMNRLCDYLGMAEMGFPV